jgi:hypothetical protein
MTRPTASEGSTGSEGSKGSSARSVARTRPSPRGYVIVALEAIVSISSALLFLAWSQSIQVNPLDRIGQVSGLASLQLRFATVGVCLLAIVLIGSRTRWRESVTRLVCAAIAGLATGLIAGGLLVALLGTPLPLVGGDAGVITAWAESLRGGGAMPVNYPPLFIRALALWADVSGTTALDALKPLELVTTSLFGPAAYLAWRTLLPAPWALGIGLVAALPMIDPYKPYTNVVLIVFVPVLMLFLRSLRDCAARSYLRVVLAGAAFGGVFAVLFLTYSGWYLWSAPGVLAAILLSFPWRTGRTAQAAWTGRLRGLGFLVTSAAVFGVISAHHLAGLLFVGTGEKDRFFYFDVYVDPAYIAMWRSDLPGNTGPWPPPAELGGVGLFTVLLVAGLGAALTLGMRDRLVVTACCLLASAWLMRFYFAAQMYETGAVQLYPRTTPQILYCLLMLSGFALYLLWQRVKAASWLAMSGTGNGQPPPPAARNAGIAAALCALLLLFASIGSAISDRYMPREDNSVGRLAWASHFKRQPDGDCSVYVPPDRCIPPR